jgi:hypothetical protein
MVQNERGSPETGVHTVQGSQAMKITSYANKGQRLLAVAGLVVMITVWSTKESFSSMYYVIVTT